MIDCDVHPAFADSRLACLEYMPASWRAWMQRDALQRPGASLHEQKRFADQGEARESQRDAFTQLGRVQTHLDEAGLDRALMTDAISASAALAYGDVDYSAVLASASNDCLLDLFDDERLLLNLQVTPLDARLAVKEIDRLGDDLRVAAVHVPIIDRPLGDRHYYPIYEAAIERGLPIAVHPVQAGFARYEPALPGVPVGLAQLCAVDHMAALYSIIDLVFTGTLERYPDLRIAFLDCGFEWVVPLTWKIDTTWHGARIDVPWVKKWPAEYVATNMRFSFRPVAQPVDWDGPIAGMIEQRLSDNLLWSSDFPYRTRDAGGSGLDAASQRTQDRILHDNAAEFLRLP